MVFESARIWAGQVLSEVWPATWAVHGGISRHRQIYGLMDQLVFRNPNYGFPMKWYCQISHFILQCVPFFTSNRGTYQGESSTRPPSRITSRKPIIHLTTQMKSTALKQLQLFRISNFWTLFTHLSTRELQSFPRRVFKSSFFALVLVAVNQFRETCHLFLSTPPRTHY